MILQLILLINDFKLVKRYRRYEYDTKRIIGLNVLNILLSCILLI